MSKAEQFLAARELGFTHSQIAKMHGVSRQYVAAVVGKYRPESFKIVAENQCVYPGWRKWMNDNKISRSELVRRMGNKSEPSAIKRLSDYMRGDAWPSRPVIMKLLSATGLSFQEMFSREGE